MKNLEPVRAEKSVPDLKKYKALLVRLGDKISLLEAENMELRKEKEALVEKAKISIGRARQEAKNARARAKRIKAKLDFLNSESY